MSTYEEKDGDISLFTNDKEGNENRPDLTGYALIDGAKMRVSLWTKDSGKLKFSGRVEPPYNGSGESRKSASSSAVPF